MGSLYLRILEIYSLFGLVLVANGRIVLTIINSITMSRKGKLSRIARRRKWRGNSKEELKRNKTIEDIYNSKR
jgi:hypothetical protein